MHWLLAIVILGITPTSAMSDVAIEKHGFTKLKDALAAIDSEMDKQDSSGLQNVLHRYLDYKYVTGSRGNSRLVDYAQNTEFPSDEESYSIDVFNGKIDIEFLKRSDKWYLAEISATK